MKNNKLILLLIFAMVLWGGSWTSGKLLTYSAPTDIIIFWRFLLTTLSMIPLLFAFKVTLKVKLKELFLLFLGGFIIFIYNIGFISGLQTGFAGAGGVLVTGLNPVFTFFLTILIVREKASLKQIFTLVLGFAGGLIMLEIWHASTTQIFDGGNLFFLLASCCWAVLTILSQKIQKNVHFIVYSFYIYLFCTVFAFALSLHNQSLSLTPAGIPFWLNMSYLSIGATTIATTIYFLCTKQLGSRIASSFIFTVPVTALFFSWWLLGEVPRLPTIAGGAITIIAVYLINGRKS
jgi:drug/metabolite transporter (DMT)-like permease